MKKIMGISSFLAIIALNLCLTITRADGEFNLSVLNKQAIAGGCEIENLGVCIFKCDDDEFSSCSSGGDKGVSITCDDAKEVSC